MDLYNTCEGNWEQLATKTGVGILLLDKFLDYAARFLSNIGNYFGSGDQKFTPDISGEALNSLASVSSSSSKILEQIKPDDIAYNMYLQLGVDGLRGLENYDPTTKVRYGDKHIVDGGLYTVTKDVEMNSLTVKVDQSRVISRGKSSLGRMLLKLFIYRCTADVSNCRRFYENLSIVDGEALKWRDILVSKKDPPLVFSQANTYLVGDDVKIKEYEPTAQGVVQSWAERSIE
ncbi:bifunctional diacylglycerol diphosphate phosphatase/phosphatidate phosphatase [Aspergillus niger]|nr:bifunctional diacylglycerol diphosphate phosphatase/phosphatidate phosphatase [Aspergillus niger]